MRSPPASGKERPGAAAPISSGGRSSFLATCQRVSPAAGKKTVTAPAASSAGAPTARSETYSPSSAPYRVTNSLSEPSASGSPRRRTDTPQQRAVTTARSPARARSLRTGKAKGRLTRALAGAPSASLPNTTASSTPSQATEPSETVAAICTPHSAAACSASASGPSDAALPDTRSAAVKAQTGSSAETLPRTGALPKPGQKASRGMSTSSARYTLPATRSSMRARMRQRPCSSSQVAERLAETTSARASQGSPPAASSQGISARKGISRS